MLDLLIPEDFKFIKNSKYYIIKEVKIIMIDLVICCDEFKIYKDQGLIHYIQASNKNGAFINLKEIEKPVNILHCPFCGVFISQVSE